MALVAESGLEGDGRDRPSRAQEAFCAGHAGLRLVGVRRHSDGLTEGSVELERTHLGLAGEFRQREIFVSASVDHLANACDDSWLSNCFPASRSFAVSFDHLREEVQQGALGLELGRRIQGSEEPLIDAESFRSVDDCGGEERRRRGPERFRRDVERAEGAAAS